MDKNDIMPVIHKFKAAIESQGIDVSRIVLFGSYAKGTADENSDIDIVVISDDFARYGFWQRIEILTNAIVAVFEPIEATAFTVSEYESNQSPIAEFAHAGTEVYAS